MGCGCINGYYNNSKLKLNFGTCIKIDETMLQSLKEKVICEFQKLITVLEKGHKLDHEFILEEISLINLIDENEISLQDALFYLEFYLNNEFNSKWRTF